MHCSPCYPHPYKLELDVYVPDDSFLKKAVVQVGQFGLGYNWAISVHLCAVIDSD